MTDSEPIRYNSDMASHAMKIMYKVWLDCDGKAFGEGPDRLLQRVETTGSLHKAAAEMKMSYRKAWLMLRAMEQRLGFPCSSARSAASPEEAPSSPPQRERS